MELILLDALTRPIGVIDKFKSLIWTDRYWKSGDFELQTNPDIDILNKLANTKYFSFKESEHIMVLEIINIYSDIEEGNKLFVKGRSLESILDRRIVWEDAILTGNFQTNIQQLLIDNVINPTISARKINQFVFEANTDATITSLLIDNQFLGQEIYDVISFLCESRNIGFKITSSDSGNFVFKLYAGVDRSYNQFINPYVVFSPDFDNLINADYVETDQYLKTIAKVFGEDGVGNIRTTVIVDPFSNSDLSRRELTVDAKNITRNTSSGTLTDEEYLLQLEEKGIDELSNNKSIKAFNGEVDTSQLYTYGEDFFMGDILQIKDDYGHQTTSRVIEMIYFEDESGIKTYPTFTNID